MLNFKGWLYVISICLAAIIVGSILPLIFNEYFAVIVLMGLTAGLLAALFLALHEKNRQKMEAIERELSVPRFYPR